MKTILTIILSLLILQELVKYAPLFEAEMVLKSSLSKKSSFFKFMNKKKEGIKLAIYSVVLLLNVNLILSTHGAGVAEGFTSIASGLQGRLQPKYNDSLIISLILAFIALLGYAAQTCLACVLEVPVVSRRIDEVIDDGMRSLKDPRNNRALGQILLSVIITSVVIILHKVESLSNEIRFFFFTTNL